MRASARLFDKAIGKIGKQDVQVIHAQFLITYVIYCIIPEEQKILHDCDTRQLYSEKRLSPRFRLLRGTGVLMVCVFVFFQSHSSWITSAISARISTIWKHPSGPPRTFPISRFARSRRFFPMISCGFRWSSSRQRSNGTRTAVIS